MSCHAILFSNDHRFYWYHMPVVFCFLQLSRLFTSTRVNSHGTCSLGAWWAAYAAPARRLKEAGVSCPCVSMRETYACIINHILYIYNIYIYNIYVYMIQWYSTYIILYTHIGPKGIQRSWCSVSTSDTEHFSPCLGKGGRLPHAKKSRFQSVKRLPVEQFETCLNPSIGGFNMFQSKIRNHMEP